VASRSSAPPFKFNSSWITDPGFLSLVRSTWEEMKSWTNNSSILLLCSKLKHLKGFVIQWQIAKKKQLLAELNFIELKLSEIFERCPSQIFEQEDLDLLKSSQT
jgi:hypothetical protein